MKSCGIVGVVMIVTVTMMVVVIVLGERGELIHEAARALAEE